MENLAEPWAVIIWLNYLQSTSIKIGSMGIHQLKRSITNAPVMDYADSSRHYKLHVDPSSDGLDGALY